MGVMTGSLHLGFIMHSIIDQTLHTRWPTAAGLCWISLTRWTSCIACMIYNSRAVNKSRPDRVRAKEGKRRARLSLLPPSAVGVLSFLGQVTKTAVGRWPSSAAPLLRRNRKTQGGQVHSSTASVSYFSPTFSRSAWNASYIPRRLKQLWPKKSEMEKMLGIKPKILQQAAQTQFETVLKGKKGAE